MTKLNNSVNLPTILKTDNCYTLYINQKPYLVLGGEIHNSSASTLEYMEERVWPNIRNLNLNTLLAPVYWELIEPHENEFDFTLVEGLILQARHEKVKLVLLWFASWKNALSTYTPSWVKADSNRFLMAKDINNLPVRALTPFCEETVKADTKAFVKFMEFLRLIDSEENTVIMVQLENEVGLLTTDRDYSDLSNELFTQKVPKEIEELTGKKGNWKMVYDKSAEESFMAYGFSKAMESIAAAGKSVYPLPIYINAWTVQYMDEPAGSYPSGGPNHLNFEIWKKIGKHIDAIAPDIYLPDFRKECNRYHLINNPLLIPEARRDAVTSANVFYAVAKHFAICYSPFAIEDLLSSDVKENYSPLVVQDEAASMDHTNTGYYLSNSYKTIGSMWDVISKYRGTDRMTGFLYGNSKKEILEIGGCKVQIKYKEPCSLAPCGGGLIISPTDGEFIIAGMQCDIEFLREGGLASTNDQLHVDVASSKRYDYLYIDEGTFVDNQWKRLRRLNGDELSIKFGLEVSVLKLALY